MVLREYFGEAARSTLLLTATALSAIISCALTRPSSRRFPPPWTVEETAPCFIVRDANKQTLAFVYCEDEPGRRTTGKLLTRDEARRIAANIAKLPELLTAEPRPDANALFQRR
jgi:hypothetical protein